MFVSISFCLLRKRIPQRSCIEAGRNKTERKTAFKQNAKHALRVKPYAQLENSTSEGRVFVVLAASHSFAASELSSLTQWPVKMPQQLSNWLLSWPC